MPEVTEIKDSDPDMECEPSHTSIEVKKPTERNPVNESTIEVRPQTPDNNLSGFNFEVDAGEPAKTPLKPMFPAILTSTPVLDSSFIIRVGVDKAKRFRPMPMVTSTPFSDRQQMSHTQPVPSTISGPNLSPLNLKPQSTSECNPMTDSNMEVRPHTPDNELSRVDTNEPPTTPIKPIFHAMSTPTFDSSFISRGGIEKVKKYRLGPMTTSAFHDGYKISQTLPALSSLSSSNLSPCQNPHCRPRSAETYRKRPILASTDSLKRGPDGIPLMYTNPFSPTGKILEHRLKAHKKLKRTCLETNSPPAKLNMSESSESEIELEEVARRPRLRDFNVSRFHEEFIKLEEIGKGDFGGVYKCVNRLNGCVYAIKKTLKPIINGHQEKVARNEIFAHGLLFHPNIVRHFSSWKEDEFVYLQNEFCDGGNLEKYIETHSMSESSLRFLLLQIASALEYMHGLQLAHLDIKPGNIFLCIGGNRDTSIESDEGFGDDRPAAITFKLGDLGHVAAFGDDDPEDGDCRYIAREIIQENYRHLDKADIFALALTVYEAAGGGPLPKNGEEWQKIRNGRIKSMNNLTKEFNDILKRCISMKAQDRPSASDLVNILNPSPPSTSTCTSPVSTQAYYRANSRLTHEVSASNNQAEAVERLQERIPAGAVPNSRLVGRNTKRSSSTMF